MVFFRKGGGMISTQSITLRHIFVPQHLLNIAYKIFYKEVELVGGGSVINGAYPV